MQVYQDQPARSLLKEIMKAKTKFYKADYGNEFVVQINGDDIKVKVFYVSRDKVKLYNIARARTIGWLSNEFEKIMDRYGQEIKR
jgi:hypothetical protein